MRRTWTSRCAAFLVALAFQASANGDALGAHPCPHHDALPSAEPAAPSAEAAAQQPAASADHAAHGAAAAGHDAGGSPCTCPGQCSVSGGVAHPTIDDRAIAIAGNDAREPGRAGGLPLRAPAADYLLPFAHAPPGGR
jgi:hypothetical protein